MEDIALVLTKENSYRNKSSISAAHHRLSSATFRHSPSQILCPKAAVGLHRETAQCPSGTRRIVRRFRLEIALHVGHSGHQYVGLSTRLPAQENQQAYLACANLAIQQHATE